MDEQVCKWSLCNHIVITCLAIKAFNQLLETVMCPTNTMYVLLIIPVSVRTLDGVHPG